MNTHVDRTQEKKSQVEAESLSRKQGGGPSASNFMENRPEAIAINTLQRMENDSPRVRQLKAFQDRADGRATRQLRPIQKKQHGSGSLGKGGPVVQRVIEVDGNTYGAADQVAFEKKYDESHRKAMLVGMQDIQPTPPQSIAAALADKRRFHLTFEDLEEFGLGFNYVADYGQVEALAGNVAGGRVREAAEKPEFIQRPETGFEQINIAGLLSCVGIVIEAFKDDGVTAAVGAHFVTPEAIIGGQLNDRGTGQLSAMLESLDGYGEQRRAFLCYQQDEYASKEDENTAAALKAISLYLTSGGVSGVKVSNTGSEISYTLSSDGSSSLS